MCTNSVMTFTDGLHVFTEQTYFKKTHCVTIHAKLHDESLENMKFYFRTLNRVTSTQYEKG